MSTSAHKLGVIKFICLILKFIILKNNDLYPTISPLIIWEHPKIF